MLPHNERRHVIRPINWFCDILCLLQKTVWQQYADALGITSTWQKLEGFFAFCKLTTVYFYLLIKCRRSVKTALQLFLQSQLRLLQWDVGCLFSSSRTFLIGSSLRWRVSRTALKGSILVPCAKKHLTSLMRVLNRPAVLLKWLFICDLLS